MLNLDQTKAVLDAEDSSRFSVETDSKNPEKSKKIEFVARNDNLAQYWTDVFNKKLHFEVRTTLNKGWSVSLGS